MRPITLFRSIALALSLGVSGYIGARSRRGLDADHGSGADAAYPQRHVENQLHGQGRLIDPMLARKEAPIRAEGTVRSHLATSLVGFPLLGCWKRGCGDDAASLDHWDGGDTS